MSKIEELEKHVLSFEKQLKAEVEKNSEVRKQLEDLAEQLAYVKSNVKIKYEIGTGKIAMEGFLEKKGAVRHNWLKRWFVLEDKKALIYYDRRGDKEPRGVIPLTNAVCFAHVEKKQKVKSLFFNIRTENRDFLIRAESKEVKDAWVKAIKASCVKGQLTEEEKKLLAKRGVNLLGKTAEEIAAETKSASQTQER